MRLGSSIADLYVIATSGPTLGTVISLRQTASSRTIASTALCSFSYSAFNAARADSIASAMRSNVAWPVTNSRIRASNPLRVTAPTFRPKPRNIPRMLNSTSISRPSSCLRPTSSARTSCDAIDLACTCWNHPIRSSCASPRASLRSVFTVIADKAAFTCRVSSRTVSNPASFNPACSHCDNGPASSPIRFTAKPSASKKATTASGSLATFASFTILPCASTTHTLEALDVHERVTFVIHDWGSALGFDWANRHREAVKGIAFMEAIVAPQGRDHWDKMGMRPALEALRSEAGEAMVLQNNYFIEEILPNAILRKLSDEEMAEYRRPFAEPGEGRRPTLTWPRQIPIEGEPPMCMRSRLNTRTG